MISIKWSIKHYTDLRTRPKLYIIQCFFLFSFFCPWQFWKWNFIFIGPDRNMYKMAWFFLRGVPPSRGSLSKHHTLRLDFRHARWSVCHFGLSANPCVCSLAHGTLGILSFWSVSQPQVSSFAHWTLGAGTCITRSLIGWKNVPTANQKARLTSPMKRVRFITSMRSQWFDWLL